MLKLKLQFFGAQVSHLYTTTGKTTALTIWSVNASTFPPSICHKVLGLDAMILVFWAPKSLQMVTVAMKLKDNCSLEEKL